MARKLAYWSSTAVVAIMLLMAISYLTGSEQVVSGFAKSGYPQHLRMALLALLIVSYVARPANRRLPVRTTAIESAR